VGVTGSETADELLQLSKSSLAALTKKAGEIPLSTLSIGARDSEMGLGPSESPYLKLLATESTDKRTQA
jgi:hypothetical protein